jgi:hypothetical protein
MSVDILSQLQSVGMQAAQKAELEEPASPINWAAVNQTTRWHATSTTFGPLTKILLTAPVWALAVFLLSSGHPGTPGRVLHLLGAIAVVVSAVWSRTIWAAGRR